MNTNIEYTFEVSESTLPDYKFASSISTWLAENLSNLTDDQGEKIFGKVNTGFNEETLKTFGKKPGCDVYINNVDYSSDFDEHKPQKVHTIIIFYVKGANNTSYEKACNLHDYIMQQFLINPSFKELEDIVQNTHIDNSELMNQSPNKKWGVMGAFELTHDLY